MPVASPLDRQGGPFSLGGVTKTGEDVFLGQIRKIRKDFLVRHSAQDIIDGYPHAANTRLAAALPRLDAQNPRIVHGTILAQYLVNKTAQKSP